MLEELLTYIRTPTTKEAKAFGHLYESISLIKREKRCKDHWLAHRNQSKETILSCLQLLKKCDSLLILGAGPLYEIPLEELANTFKQIDLIDVVHLESTKKKYAHFPHVRFIEADITELEKDLYIHKKIKNFEPTLFLNDQYDFVISANLLSQLSYHLRAFLEKNAKPKIESEVLDDFCFQVSLDHYNYLTKFTCPVLLITDTETNFVDKDANILAIQRPFINFSLPMPTKSWWWELAPIPEYSKEHSVRMKVSAFLLNY